MSSPKRAADGRFVPRTGDAVLPPKKQQARDEHGQFIKSERVVSSKPYSNAVRELLDAPEGSTQPQWTENGRKYSEAQALAMVHLSLARAGNVQVGLMLIDRAEGKVPQAAEDREAAIKAGGGIKLLADLLGIKVPQARPEREEEILDAEEVIVPQLSTANGPAEKGDEKCQAGNSSELGSSESDSVPSQPSSSSEPSFSSPQPSASSRSEYIGPTHACAGPNCPGEEHRRCPVGACPNCGATFEERERPCKVGMIHSFTLHPNGNEPHHGEHLI